MSLDYLTVSSQEDFDRARKKEFIQRIGNILKPHAYELLSLAAVKKILSPTKETYQGMKVVPINLIVGSEGRYRDFNKAFLPRHDHLRPRWSNIDKLHLQNIILPPVQLYEIGGVYFVRDGNHRISVARSQGGEMVDAEVISLDSSVNITPDMSKDTLKQAVINYEYKIFDTKTQFSSIVPDYSLKFTSTGRYTEVLFHILEHKYYINQGYKEEFSLSSAVFSWFNTVYQPILNVIRKYNLLTHFPDRTEGDLYVWISKHWHYLKEKDGDEVEITQAAQDIVQAKGMSLKQRMRYFFLKMLFPRK